MRFADLIKRNTTPMEVPFGEGVVVFQRYTQATPEVRAKLRESDSDEVREAGVLQAVCLMLASWDLEDGPVLTPDTLAKCPDEFIRAVISKLNEAAAAENPTPASPSTSEPAES